MRKQDIVRKWAADNNVNMAYDMRPRRGIQVLFGEAQSIIDRLAMEKMPRATRADHAQRIMRQLTKMYDNTKFAEALYALARVVRRTELNGVAPATLVKAQFKAARLIKLAADDLSAVKAPKEDDDE